MSDMADPLPENIDGEKTVQYSHEIHHRVNWGHVALASAVIVLLLAARWYLDVGDDDQDGITA